MARIGELDVRAIVSTNSEISINPFIGVASRLTDYVDSCDSDSVLSVLTLKDIELFLAAHFYSLRDQLYSSKKTEDASAEFQTGVKGTGSLDTTDYGRNAMLIDVTGCLAKLNEQAKKGKLTASLTWIGKPPSTQTAYESRD